MQNENTLLPRGAGNGDLRVEVASRWEAAMRRGDMEAAWRETDRLEIPRRELERTGRFVWSPDHLLWSGGEWRGKRVLIRCNHGLGDTLQFVRFIPYLRREAKSVTLFAQPPLVPLLGSAPEFGVVCDGWTTSVPPTDIEMEVMELAYILRCRSETLPRNVPYLPVKRIQQISRILVPRESRVLNIGILWQASDWDKTRSLPLPLLQSLSALRHVRFFSLQQNSAGVPPSWTGVDLSPRTGGIIDLAAAMLQLDLIVTVDCMAAHLAGALGVPVWLLLKEPADWRWMDHRLDSPWYPTMRLFRQKAPSDWTPVCQAVASALEALAESTATRPA